MHKPSQRNFLNCYSNFFLSFLNTKIKNRRWYSYYYHSEQNLGLNFWDNNSLIHSTEKEIFPLAVKTATKSLCRNFWKSLRKYTLHANEGSKTRSGEVSKIVWSSRSSAFDGMMHHPSTILTASSRRWYQMIFFHWKSRNSLLKNWTFKMWCGRNYMR